MDKIIIVIFIIIFFAIFFQKIVENFRGIRRGGGRYRGGYGYPGSRRVGYYGGLGAYYGGPGYYPSRTIWRQNLNPNLYVRRFRRGWISPQNNYWYNFISWPATWLGVGPCKKGCTPDGCPIPGNTYDECVWASDCYGCVW